MARTIEGPAAVRAGTGERLDTPGACAVAGEVDPLLPDHGDQRVERGDGEVRMEALPGTSAEQRRDDGVPPVAQLGRRHWMRRVRPGLTAGSLSTSRVIGNDGALGTGGADGQLEVDGR
jgi:hypothetical protein